MTTDDPPRRGFSLRRWSQRKLEATRVVGAPDAAASLSGNAQIAPSAAATVTPPSALPVASHAPTQEAPPLPPVESLTIESDFSAFLDPKVDEGLRLQALKKLFSDPRFNVMDGLDTYIADYSIADPIAPELVRQLAHARYLFDPPRTRVNEAGIVEDVPADEIARDADAASREIPADSATDSPSTSSPAASPGSEPDRAAGSAERAAQPPAGSEPARQ